jgi:hypothetical protein
MLFLLTLTMPLKIILGFEITDADDHFKDGWHIILLETKEAGMFKQVILQYKLDEMIMVEFDTRFNQN